MKVDCYRSLAYEAGNILMRLVINHPVVKETEQLVKLTYSEYESTVKQSCRGYSYYLGLSVIQENLKLLEEPDTLFLNNKPRDVGTVLSYEIPTNVLFETFGFNTTCADAYRICAMTPQQLTELGKKAGVFLQNDKIADSLQNSRKRIAKMEQATKLYKSGADKGNETPLAADEQDFFNRLHFDWYYMYIDSARMYDAGRKKHEEIMMLVRKKAKENIRYREIAETVSFGQFGHKTFFIEGEL